MNIRKILKSILPDFVLRAIRFVLSVRLICFIYFYRAVILPLMVWKLRRKAASGQKIKVAFSAWNVSMWKYGTVYEAMAKDPRFDPFVILAPTLSRGEETARRDLEEMRQIFTARGYKIYPKDYILERDLDFGGDFETDILFFTQPYSTGNIRKNMWRFVYCYCPYSFSSDPPAKWSCNTPLQNFSWKIFLPLKDSVDRFRKMQRIKGRNCVFAGYPFGDELRNKECKFDPWKKSPEDVPVKRIIWAAHFSITETSVFKLSNFLRLHQVMLDLAEEFKGKVQWVFKPHPWLFSMLEKNPEWGQQRAKAYFEKWRTMGNTQLEQGNYLELFAKSDAIIHDCGSFTVEYIYTQKPGMYLRIPNETRSADKVGGEALACYYQGVTKEEIREFIIDVVLGGNDPKARERKAFYDKYLLPPNGNTAAQNIIDEIGRGLGFKKE